MQDGMDIALVRIDKEKKILSFSGAMRPLLLIRNGVIQSYKASRTSIGGLIQESFEVLHLQLEPKDRIVLYSDGITDQFGGDKQRKMGNKNLKEILLRTVHLTSEETIEEIKKSFNEWKKEQTQTDDVLIMVADV